MGTTRLAYPEQLAAHTTLVSGITQSTWLDGAVKPVSLKHFPGDYHAVHSFITELYRSSPVASPTFSRAKLPEQRAVQRSSIIPGAASSNIYQIPRICHVVRANQPAEGREGDGGGEKTGQNPPLASIHHVPTRSVSPRRTVSITALLLPRSGTR